MKKPFYFISTLTFVLIFSTFDSFAQNVVSTNYFIARPKLEFVIDPPKKPIQIQVIRNKFQSRFSDILRDSIKLQLLSQDNNAITGENDTITDFIIESNIEVSRIAYKKEPPNEFPFVDFSLRYDIIDVQNRNTRRILKSGSLQIKDKSASDLLENFFNLTGNTFATKVKSDCDSLRTTRPDRIESNIATMKIPKGERFALIIGVKSYQNLQTLLPLKYVENDVDAMKALVALSGIPEKNVIIVMDQANRADIYKSIYDLKTEKHIKSEDTLYVFFSAHGVVDLENRVFFLPQDANDKLPSALGIRANEFIDEIRTLKTRNTVFFLDICRSGAAFSTGSSKGSVSSVGIPFSGSDGRYDASAPLIRRSANEPRLTGIAASMANQDAQEDSKYQMSLFTKFLVDGITQGIADKNNDGDISLEELSDYLIVSMDKRIQESQSENEQNARLRPQRAQIAPNGADFIVARRKKSQNESIVGYELF